jgi:hypothetical protein
VKESRAGQQPTYNNEKFPQFMAVIGSETEEQAKGEQLYAWAYV